MSKPEWIEIAESYLGTKEIPGPKNNPVIMSFYKTVGHHNINTEDTSWCAAYVGHCLDAAGLPHTGSLVAQSYRKYGTKRQGKPRLGDIIIMKRGNQSWQGHVFFFLREVGNYYEGIGGNQSNAVTIARFPKSAVFADGVRVPPTAIQQVVDSEETEADYADLGDEVLGDTEGVEGPKTLENWTEHIGTASVAAGPLSRLWARAGTRTGARVAATGAGTAGTVGGAMYALNDPIIILGAIVISAVSFCLGYWMGSRK